jgi:hypothetical protein
MTTENALYENKGEQSALPVTFIINFDNSDKMFVIVPYDDFIEQLLNIIL